MKKYILFLLPLFLVFTACGGEDSPEVEDENEPELILSFEEGGADAPNDYFDGVVGQLKAVDAKLKYVFELDDMNASVDSITNELDSMVIMIAAAQKVLKLYDDKEWPQTANFQAISRTWYNSVQSLIDNYYYKMAEPMSRPDSSWSEEDKALYNEYVLAYYEFFEIDQEWVAFQETFATANDFELKVVEEDHL